MKYADGYGLGKMLDNNRTYENEDPVFWKPSPLLVDLIAAGHTFEDLN